MQALLERLKEPSSYAGLGLILGGFGINIDAGVMQNVIGILAGASGVASFFIGEKGKGK